MSDENKTKQRLSKADIGAPSNFKHVVHVGSNAFATTTGANSNDELAKDGFFAKDKLNEQHAEQIMMATKDRTGVPQHTERKVKVTKDQIGMPTDYRHVSHAGAHGVWGQMDPTILAVLQKAGVSDEELQDKRISRFIKKFIKKYMGGDVKGQISKATRPPLLRSHSDIPLKRRQAPPPPGLPTRPPSQNIRGTVRRRPKTRAPLPPAPNDGAPTPPDQNDCAPPLPPPPPPLPLMPAAPVETSVLPPASHDVIDSSVDMRSALLDSIKSGPKLKTVVREEHATEATEPTRDNLLEDIRKGIALKPVSERTLRNSLSNVSTGGNGVDLAQALRQALDEFVFDSDGKDTSTSDDEWDD